jgi:general secretion pathway protein G
MIVLFILMTLASVSVLAYSQIQKQAQEREARIRIESLQTPLELYRMNVGTFPTTQQGLEALKSAPSDLADPDKWDGPYIKKELPTDPWGNPYQYEYPGNHGENEYDIWSIGPDGTSGTEDDIVSWEES